MDITEALAPVSDQLDAIELVNPRTFTIDTGSRLGKRDGKTVAEIRLVGFDRVWRPSKGMLDVLAACWGTDGKAWAGRSVTLFNDPEVMFGKEKTGGIRISHLSHIDKARSVSIRTSGAGRKKQWHIEPIIAASAHDWYAEADALTDADSLRALYLAAPKDSDARVYIAARAQGLTAGGESA